MQRAEPFPLADRIRVILKKDLEIEPPDDETDLIETGTYNSMMFIQLLLSLEQDFGIKINLEEVELDSFRSVASIARFIADQNGSSA